jgi:hypothetical protein
MNAEEIAHHLEGCRKSGSGFMACCPAHEDREPSLSITDGDNGQVLVHCFAGCAQEDVIRELRNRGLWPAARNNGSGLRQRTRPKKVPTTANMATDTERSKYKKVAEYLYAPGLRKVRLENPSEPSSKGKPKKRFSWEHQEGGEWLSGDGGQEKPLYTNKTFRDRDQIGVALGVEGEGKADRCDEFGIPAFSYAAGITERNAETLADVDAVLWPDKDEPGGKQAMRAAQFAMRHARSVRIVEPPSELCPSGDIIDAVTMLGWGAAEINALIQNAKPYVLREEAAEHPKVWTLSELRAADIREAEPIVEDFLREGETIALVGKPKIGKSRLAHQFALNLSRGEDFLGHRVKRSYKVLVLDFENRSAGVKARFAKMSSPHPGDGNLHIYSPETLASIKVSLATKEGIAELERIVTSISPDILLVDTWRLLLGGDENKAEVVVKGLTALSRLRERLPKLATILIHHLRKQQGDHPAKLRLDPYAWTETASGHYSFIGHVDACFGLEREHDSNGDELIVFGGVARNSDPYMLLLEDDPDTLRFDVASGEAAAKKLFTDAEKKIWEAVRGVDRFTFSEAQSRARTKNKKAVSATLRKAKGLGLVEQLPDKTYTRKGALAE